MEIGGVEPGELSEHALGFRLGPRINAAGRMQRADAALELLVTEDPARAGEVARELDFLNRDRQEAETRILFAAEAAAAAQAHQAAIVVAGEGWHPGVVGIVASRLVERWRRPCVVIAGGREPPHFTAYPHHQFIHTVGALRCCDNGGCWKSRTLPLGDGDVNDRPDALCVDVVGTLPRCMDMITADEVIRRVELYFQGGALPARTLPA